MVRIDLHNVSKIYRLQQQPVYAVWDLSLNVACGECIALLGPCGSGKTSILRMIAGLDDITSGEIVFDGVRVNELCTEQRNAALIFETCALYPNLTVADNIGFPLAMRGVGRGARAHRIRRMAELLHIENTLTQKLPVLTGKQRLQVALGRALIREPLVLLLDNLLSHHDAPDRLQMLSDLKYAHRKFAKTMLFATRDVLAAQVLADRIAVLNDARLQQIGTWYELYHSPANIFVADAIDEQPVNIFLTELNNSSLRHKQTDSGLAFQPPATTFVTLAGRGQKTWLVGIRPQHLFLRPGKSEVSPGQTLPATSIDGEVIVSEYLGKKTMLVLTSGNTEFRALVDTKASVGRGEIVKLYYDPADLMLFDERGIALPDESVRIPLPSTLRPDRGDFYASHETRKQRLSAET